MPEPAPKPNPVPAPAPPAVSTGPSLPPAVRKHEPSSGTTNMHPVRTTRGVPPKRYGDYQVNIASVASHMAKMAVGLLGATTQSERDLRYAVALFTDTCYGTLEAFPPTLILLPAALQSFNSDAVAGLKAKKGSDPNSPTFKQALAGLHAEEFDKAMQEEIKQLEQHKTWEVIRREDAPKGANILPGTWVFWIKCYPDDRLRKFKAHFCVRGDKQIEGVDYFDKYSPVVSWLTVSQGLATRQVDFSNAFVQTTLNENVYIHCP